MSKNQVVDTNNEKEFREKFKDVKARGWTFIIYEDSTDIGEFHTKVKDLARTGLTGLYAKHDKDVRANGEAKKTHYHVILMWEGPTSYKNALKTAQEVANVNYIEPIRSIVGAARYLTHMDDADKHQYDKDIVKTVGDVDYTELISSSRNDRNEVKAMAEYIRDNNITHFDVFAFYCMTANVEWFRILSERNTFFFKNLIQAQHFRLKEEVNENLGNVIERINGQYVDVRTGEIVGTCEEKNNEKTNK